MREIIRSLQGDVARVTLLLEAIVCMSNGKVTIDADLIDYMRAAPIPKRMVKLRGSGDGKSLILENAMGGSQWKTLSARPESGSMSES